MEAVKLQHDLSGIPMSGLGDARLGADATVFPMGSATGEVTYFDYEDTTYQVTADFTAEYLDVTFDITGGPYTDLVSVNLTPDLWSQSDKTTFRTNPGVNSGLASVEFYNRNGRVIRHILIQKFLNRTQDVVYWAPKEGSLARALHDSTKALLESGTHDSWLSENDHVERQYAFDKTSWIGSVDMTAASVANDSDSPQERGIVAVTPQHATCAHHWAPGVGWKVYFIGASGAVYERTVVRISAQSTYISETTGNPSGDSDRAVCLLDSPLPADVHPMKVPGDWHPKMLNHTYVFAGSATRGGLGFSLNKQNRVFPMVAVPNTGTIGGLHSEVFDGVNYGVKYGIWYYPLGGAEWDLQGYTPHYDISYKSLAPHELSLPSFDICSGAVKGDSGSPSIVLLNDDPVLWGHFYGNYSGPAYLNSKPVIDAMIQSVDAAEGIATGFSTVEADASSYPDYP